MLPVSCLKRDCLRVGGQGSDPIFFSESPSCLPSCLSTSLAPCQQGNLFKQLLLTQQGSSLPLRILLLFSFHGTSRRNLDWLKPWLPHGFLGLSYPEKVGRGSSQNQIIWDLATLLSVLALVWHFACSC